MALGTCNQTILAVDKTGNNFLLQVPFHLNNLARNAPNKRFLKGQGIWFLFGFRMNAKYLNDQLLDRPGVVVETAARELINKIIKRSLVPESMFPAWYKFREGMPPYAKQVEALNLAWGKKCFYFAMEMGTGKSKVYTDLAFALCMEGKINALVILTKKSLRGNIVREVHKHSPYPFKSMTPDFGTESERKKAETFIHEKEKLKVVSLGLESLSAKVEGGRAYEYLQKFMMKHKCALVVDEAHLIKDPAAIRTVNTTKLGELAEFKYLGSGTPVSQGILDLYSQYEFMNPEIMGIGNFWSFKSRYTIKGGYKDREIIGYDNVEELMELIKPWTYQVTKNEMVDLPPKIYLEPITVEMTKEQRRIYNEIRKNKVAELTSMKGVPDEIMVKNVLSAYSLLHQICAGFISYDGNIVQIKYKGELRDKTIRERKWIMPPEENPKLTEMLEFIGRNPGQQFNIWTKHIMELLAITKLLNEKGYSAAAYYGEVEEPDRRVLEKRFHSGDLQILVANQETGGTGLTFTNCNNVLYMSNSFKYIDRAQSEDRNHRIGTTKHVVYGDIVCEKSIDVRVIEVLRQKKSLADYVKERLSRGMVLDEDD